MQDHAIKRFFDSPLPGGTYLFAGCFLLATKFMLDTFIANVFLGRPWSFWGYFAPGRVAGIPGEPADSGFFLVMLLLALPFIAIGVALTVRRLRTLEMHPALAVLFFVPFVNVLFFAVLALMPTPAEVEPDLIAVPTGVPEASEARPHTLQYGRDQPNKLRSFLSMLFPAHAGKSMVAAVFVPQPLALAATILSVYLLGSYGWGLFVGLPFVLPMVSAILHGYSAKRSRSASIGVGLLSALAYAGCLIVFALEGAVCILMALPLALPVAVMGAALGHAIQSHGRHGTGRLILLVCALLPVLTGAERATITEVPLFAVTTSLDVDADAARVWEHVVSFPQLPPPTELVFRAGVAYPVCARIEGRGAGAMRYCVFSTGSFEEPITIWDEPRLLKFSVTSNPPPLQEWSPYANVHPPHLNDFLVSRGGEFRLIPLGGGRTRLEGTTWYRHNMWPAAYWRIWSDWIIHRIHLRVLTHVKALAEADRQ